MRISGTGSGLVTISGIRFTNGYANSGEGIYLSDGATVILENCQFDNCESTSTGEVCTRTNLPGFIFIPPNLSTTRL